MKIESSNLPCDLEWLKGTDLPCAIADNAPTVRIVDLFCGCGGLSLGAMEACRMGGITAEIAKAVDLDRDALEVFRTNFSLDSERAKCAPIQTLFSGTLRRPLTKEEKILAKSIGRTDLLVAGPPCQGHSDLNNHSRRLDPRNSLYARVARAAEVLRPQAVVIENVAGVMNDRGHVVARVEKVLRSHGYTVKSICIDARDLGVPQHRRRHFLVAFPEKLQSNWEDLPSYQGEPWTVGDVLEGLEDEPKSSTSIFRTPSRCTKRNDDRISYLFDQGYFELPDSERPACHRDKKHSYKAIYGRLHWDGAANTITSGFGSMGQGRYVHPSRRRVISPHEAARLQGFPDWFSFESVVRRGSLQKMIGNAVIPRVAAYIVRHLLLTGILEPLGQTNTRRASALVSSEAKSQGALTV